jgi:hypothetical protein
MKFTIIPIDGVVYKDGVSYFILNLPNIPINVHALQFNDVTNKGWIEFADTDEGIKPANEIITALPTWAIEASIKWDEAQTAELAAIEAERIAVTIIPTTDTTETPI